MQTTLSAAFGLVRAANPKRKLDNMDRRLWKLYEEAGEFAQAYLHTTSISNAKGKTWADVREEGVDALVPILDVLLTEMPDQIGIAAEVREAELVGHFEAEWHDDFALDARRGLCFFWHAGRWADTFMLADAHGGMIGGSGAGRPSYTPWHAFRIEGIHLARRLLAMLMTEMPDQPGHDVASREGQIMFLLHSKLAKWQHNRITRQQTTEDDV